MGEMPQYHIAQLVRRLVGAKITPPSRHLSDMVNRIAAGHFRGVLEELKKTDTATLKKLYTSERENEPEMAGEDWRPKSNLGL
jgi:hypothetical protein